MQYQKENEGINKNSKTHYVTVNIDFSDEEDLKRESILVQFMNVNNTKQYDE